MSQWAAPSTPIASKRDLVHLLDAGCKPKSAWRIGTEHEKFGYHLKTLTPLQYEGGDGIAAMLQGLRRFGWEPVMDGENVVGLMKGAASISLEPGGQFELSGDVLKTLHQTCNEVHTHLAQVREVADELGLGFIGIGFSPKWTLDQTPIMPKSRYRIMRDYMPRVSKLGRDMMFRTSTVQVNLDFADEADMVMKFRVGLALQPILTALFAYSPFTEGKPNGYLSYRSQVWLDTDPDRTGMLPFVFEDGMGFERYVDYALDVPMYFVVRDGRYIDASGQSFRDFLAGRLPALPGETPTLSDWSLHLTTLFPEVRLKNYLEMRGADGGPWHRLCALPAFWVGLLYDDASLAAAWDLVKDWTAEERQALREAVPKRALNARLRGRAVRDIAVETLAIAAAGLKARGRVDSGGIDERQYLDTLQAIAEAGRTPAEELLGLYHGAWGGDIDRIFAEFSY